MSKSMSRSKPTQRGGRRKPFSFPRIVVPQHRPRRFYGHGIPGVDPQKLRGKLIVVEGCDGSGRSTQIQMLMEWLESSGHATTQTGLKRSTLVSEELNMAQNGNILSHTTMSLFYATDFADQLENVIFPGLRAGRMVLADRYIYTLIARDLARGSDLEWLQNLYGIALVPDAVFYLDVSPEERLQRNFAKDYALDYWESGMDLGLSREMFDSFLKYQAMVERQFQKLHKTYGFNIVDGNRSPEEVCKELQRRTAAVLAGE
ncbi:MAG TPA: dTMP kinase [Verrucomicrobiales bacterium]|nr:dTMP kinase [Verrucomicrobiales bacterium]